jgi:hypothetical protein
LLALSKKSKGSFIDYSNETEDLTILSLVGIGYTPYEAAAYLSKLKIQRLSENDSGCKNEHYNKELRMPRDRMKRFEQK